MVETRVMIVDDEVDKSDFWVPVIKELEALGVRVLPFTIDQLNPSALDAMDVNELTADVYVIDIFNRKPKSSASSQWAGNSVAIELRNRVPGGLYVMISAFILPATKDEKGAFSMPDAGWVKCTDYNATHAIKNVRFHTCFPKWQLFPEEEHLKPGRGKKLDPRVYMLPRLKKVLARVDSAHAEQLPAYSAAANVGVQVKHNSCGFAIGKFDPGAVHVLPLLHPDNRPPEIVHLIDVFLNNTACESWKQHGTGSSLAFARSGRVRALPKLTGVFFDKMLKRLATLLPGSKSNFPQVSLRQGPFPGWMSLSIHIVPPAAMAPVGFPLAAWPLCYGRPSDDDEAENLSSMETGIRKDEAVWHQLLPGLLARAEGKPCFRMHVTDKNKPPKQREYTFLFEPWFPGIQFHFPPKKPELDWPPLEVWKEFEPSETGDGE